MTIVKCGLIMSMPLLFTAISTNVIAADGTINFTGSIIDTACVIDVGTDSKMTVQMGEISKTAFTGSGSTASTTEFDIKMKGCPAAIKTAAVKFDGTPYKGDNNVLELDTPGTGTAATGVGIQITDSAQKVVPLDTASGSYTLVETDENTLPFYASYIQQESIVVAGTANATAQFSIDYN